jgi:RNA-directed DNA polymerase
VTQENQGKKTAGVDGIKLVKPKERLVMAQHIHPKRQKYRKSKPVRRVLIPKPGKAEMRPLGIPTMLERAVQALAKMALEPEWEAKFEANSYGFRPGRSCHDAIGAIFNCIRQTPKFVFDADIKGCFDNISHSALLRKLQTYSTMRHLVKRWLKAGVLEGGEFAPTEKGTPQGGVISPLLANIALHGMAEVAAQRKRKNDEKALLVRYADDFVIFCSNEERLIQAARRVERWLKDMGLDLNSMKTKITHTLTRYEGKVGFDFLGFTVRQFPVGKTHTGKNSHKKPLGFKTIIKPSKEAIKRHTLELKKRIRELHGVSQEILIQKLNPIIQGWANYHKTVIATEIFSRCDRNTWYQLNSWAKRRHPRKGRYWRKTRYWQERERKDGKGTRMVFATSQGRTLRRHTDTSIQRHVKVVGEKSPYDGDWVYWSKRLQKHPMLYETKAALLARQKGKCRWCELDFKDGDLMEIDHEDMDRSNNRLSNLRLFHRHCHDDRHSKFGASTKRFHQHLSKRKPIKMDQRRDPDENDEELQKLHEEDVKKLRQLNIEGISIK